jgi:periplasmic copper chaperone A
MTIHVRSGRMLARLATIAIIALLVAACSSGSGGSGGIKTSGTWARTSPLVAGAGAAYLVIQNTGSAPDFLLGGSSDVAKVVEVHETVAIPDGSAAPAASGMGMASPKASDGGMGTGGSMMGMQKMDRLEIPAGGSVELKPGSYHLMLIDLTRELKAGEKIDLTLKFEKAGDVKVTAEVREG